MQGGVARLNFKSTFPNVSMHPSTRDGGADLEKPAFHSSVFYGEREAIRADTGARSPGILWTLEVWGRRVKKKNARRTSFDLPIFLTKSNLKRRFQLGGKKKFPLLIISTFPTSTILMWCVWSCNLVWNRPPWTSQKLHSRKTFPFHWIGLKTRLYLLFFFDASDHEMAEGLPWTRVRLCCHTTNLLRTPPNGPRLHHDQFIQRLEVIQLPFSAFTHENAC